MQENTAELLERFSKVTQLDIAIVQGLADEKKKEVIAKETNLRDAKNVYSKIEYLKVKTNSKTAPGLVALFFRNGFIK